MVDLYDRLIARGGIDNVEAIIELGSDDTALYQSIEERRRYVRHNRIERNSAAAKLAKKKHGYACQCCGFDFYRVYGEIGRNFIEAHHLIPLAALPDGKPVSMDPQQDFAVLCSNCHRMVHRQKEPLLIADLAKLSWEL